jgi:hypothetical protein
MSRNNTAGLPRQDQAWVTAAEWFAGGQRIWYDPKSARVLTEKQAAAAPGALRVFERVAAAGQDPDSVWLTLLPGFPDGSYGWAQVDRMLGDGLGPRLYVEPVGQGDSDKPGTTGTPPSSARTWSRRCGGTTACAAPSSSPSTTPPSRCSRCSAASWSGPPLATRRAR